MRRGTGSMMACACCAVGLHCSQLVDTDSLTGGAPHDEDASTSVDAKTSSDESQDGASSPDSGADGAAAGPTGTIGLGDGHDGAYVATGADVVVNSYTSVTADAAPGATQVSVSSSSGFSPGRLVLVVRVGGLASTAASGSQAPVSLDGTDVGAFRFVRLATVAPGKLGLSAAIDLPIVTGRTQIVSVPEYTDVTIPAGASIRAQNWDGSVGGILAFLATGAVRNTGLITASEAGFRGGTYRQDTVMTGPCTSADVAPPRAGQKGEGVVTDSYGSGFGGSGNVANGAGGGPCDRGGGGGGGHGSGGGKGGLSTAGVAASGGVKSTYDVTTRMTFGGGGAAGQGRLTPGFGTSGGAGGGAVFILAGSLDGGGYIRANGATASQSSGNSGGDAAAGGGGAGGLLHLRFKGAVSCGGLEARGGNGGASNGPNNGPAGPGGGGGGGRMLLQGSNFSACGGSALSGLAGVASPSSMGGTYGGAEPTGAIAGTIELLPGAFAP